MMRRTAFALVIAGLLPWATLLPGSLGLAPLPAPAQAAPVLAAEAPAADAALATEERAEAAGLEYSEEHGAGEGMPQLNARTFASQILWLILTFAFLYYLLKTKGLPRVADILEARQERISNDLDKAASLRAEAEEAAEEYAKVVAEAQTKASEAIKRTRDAVSADIGARTVALDKELAGKIAAAEAAVRQAREQALAELEDVAVEAAQAATRQLAGMEISAADAKAALAQIRQEVA
jgi:F-type H+-transporting ATPase subunit b